MATAPLFARTKVKELIRHPYMIPRAVVLDSGDDGPHAGVADFDRIAEQVMGTPWVPRNPRRVDGPAEVREILELAG